MRELSIRIIAIVFWGLAIIVVGHYFGHNIQMGFLAMMIVNLLTLNH